MKNLAVFGSGSGSNAENVFRYFRGSSSAQVVIFCTNKKNAFIVKRGQKLGVPVLYVSKKDLNEFFVFKKTLQNYAVDYIILAGFLLKIPEKMVRSYNNKIINIHPSLLPKYGGIGMYGKNVHLEVLKNKEKTSGITIHFVNERYDDGKVILQKEVCVSDCKTVEDLEKKIKSLEKKFFPEAIKRIILG